MPQSWNPDGYGRHARFVSELGRPLIDLLDPRPGQRVLDLGCGDGALTAEIAQRGCRVVGVDASPEMVQAAVERGVDARIADAHQLPFVAEFDAAFSNAALHWMQRPEAVVRGVHSALRPGGRFVGEFGGRGNVAAVYRALRDELSLRQIDAEAVDPWYFPSPEEYRSVLESAGFTVELAESFPRPTLLPGDIAAWLETFAACFLDAVREPDRAALIADVRRRLLPELCDAAGTWSVDYVRLRFAAAKRSHE